MRLASLILFLLAASIQAGTVTVATYGTAKASPDKAKVTISITTAADSAQVASTGNDAILTRIKTVMTGSSFGLPAANITDRGAVVTPPPAPDPSSITPPITAFTVKRTVDISMDDPTITAAVVDAALTAGSSVKVVSSGPYASTAAVAATMDLARKAGRTDADPRANFWAGQMGTTVTGISSVAESAPTLTTQSTGETLVSIGMTIYYSTK